MHRTGDTLSKLATAFDQESQTGVTPGMSLKKGERRTRSYQIAFVTQFASILTALMVAKLNPVADYLDSWWPLSLMAGIAIMAMSLATLSSSDHAAGCLVRPAFVLISVVCASLIVVAVPLGGKLTLWPLMIGCMAVLSFSGPVYRPAQTGRPFRPGDFRVFGIPGQGLGGGTSTFSRGAVAAGRSGEALTARILEDIAAEVTDSVVLHSLRVDANWDVDIDHVIVKGRTIILVDSKYYTPGNYSLVSDVDERGASLYIHGARNDTMARSAMPWALTRWLEKFSGCRVKAFIVIHSSDDREPIVLGADAVGFVKAVTAASARREITAALMTDRRATRTGLIDAIRELVKGRQSPRHPGSPLLGYSGT